jgi:sugar O-acyltransferase (sialic acid O-acetyltransferase NeuD family)
MKDIITDVVVIGSGGLAREFSTYFASSCNVLGYSTTTPEDIEKFQLKGVLFPSNISIESLPTKNLVLAIGSPKVKRKLYEKLSSEGFSFPSIIHETAIVSESASLSDGVIVSPMVIVGPNTKIGKLVYCNYQVGIGHDSVIGDFTQINPGAQIGGEVFVSPECLIGSNSTILQKAKLNTSITIGSGSVILGTKNKPGTLVPHYSKYLPF